MARRCRCGAAILRCRLLRRCKKPVSQHCSGADRPESSGVKATCNTAQLFLKAGRRQLYELTVQSLPLCWCDRVYRSVLKAF